MVDIIGAGLAGLLAANMLRHRQPKVFEKQSELPNNHSAVLRFRSSVVGDVLGIQFRKVSMIKSTLPWRNPVADALMYAQKNTGTFQSDRSLRSEAIFQDRFIAPSDLIAQMAEPLSIQFDEMYQFEKGKGPCISTMPMPMLMQALGYPGFSNINFNHSGGINIVAKVLNCDAYVSLNVPHPNWPFTRISITGDELIIECPSLNDSHGLPNPKEIILQPIIDAASRFLGIEGKVSNPRQINQAYAKISPLDSDIRRDFIYWATDVHKVFSLGRFATWRPGLLLDDLVQDIRLIDGWLDRRSHYDLAKFR